MKELKNYIHLYLGADVIIKHATGIEETGKLVGVTASEVEPWETLAIINLGTFQEFYVEEVKLVLRPLSDMTEEEKKEYNHRKQLKGYMPEVHADNTLWLLSKSFDLFGLIHAGLAVSKTERV